MCSIEINVDHDSGTITMGTNMSSEKAVKLLMAAVMQLTVGQELGGVESSDDTITMPGADLGGLAHSLRRRQELDEEAKP